ncbi:MAG: DNA polymerase I [Bacillota bacterium]|nr:DNA polymerase I [Bacillota bacterium]
MNAPRRKVLAVLDGSSLLHRAYHALPSLSTSAGEPTNAVYGFALMLWRLLESERPDRVLVAFDRPGPTFRHEAFDGYKAQRPSMPEDLRPQVERVKQVVSAFGFPIYELDGYEADDVIGTVARLARERGWEVLIFTGDRDALQLVNPHTRVLLMRKGVTEVDTYDVEAVRARYGVEPEQLVEVKGLMGDPSDNIPGVAGIGEKTALELIQRYGSVEGVLAHLDQLPPRQRRALEEHREEALLSKRLAAIECCAPLEIDLEALPPVAPDRDKLYQLFLELEFYSLARRLKSPAAGAPGGEEPSAGEGGEAPGLVRVAEPPAAPVEIIEGEEALRQAAAELRQVAARSGGKPPRVGVHFGLTAPAAMQADLFGLAYRLAEAGDSRPARFLPLPPEKGWRALVAEVFLPALVEPGLMRVWHDLKTSLVAGRRFLVHLGQEEGRARAWGAGAGGEDFDVMIASYLLDPGRGAHGLEEVAMSLLRTGLPQRPAALGDPRRGECPPWPAEPAEQREIASYFAGLVELVLRAQEEEEPRLAADGLGALFREVEMPLAEVLAAMELRGVAVDVPRLREMSAELGSRMEELARQIYQLAGMEFNLNSPRQLGEVLFERLKLPLGKKTKTGYSTSAEVLEALAPQHEIVARILEYRQLMKLKTTYTDALADLIHPETGRVHTTFNQTVTATGRLSSANPNLQNIPVRTEEGGRLREAFIPGRPDYSLLSADYSQIELRLLAHISEDEALIEAFRRGEDIHARTAAEIFGVPLEEVTPQMRDGAKAVNFGIVYGISSFGLAKGTGIDQAEAQAYIEGYFRRYPKVKEYLERVVREAREKGYVTTLLHRRRYLPDLHSRNYAVRSFAERTAMNTPIQGSAADIIKLAMLAVERALREEGLATAMILQVHDELLLEGPEEEMPRAAAVVRRAMEGVVQLRVPLVVEVKVGKNWREGVPYA